MFSPHDPNVLYSAANVVFRSVDDGSSWQVISPDLTRDDVSDREDFDPNTNIAPFERCAISRFAESPVQQGVFWTGFSDGLIHVSQDNGATWTDVTPDGLPVWTPVYGLEASPHDAGTAYLAAARYQHGDYQPYLFRTRDYGATWAAISQGIPEGDYTRVIREDPEREGLLYAGTEGGVYVSFDDGESWNSLQLNLSPVPIHDIVIRDGDLAVATHGRSLWILDDLPTLHQFGQFEDVEAGASAHLFRPRPTYRILSEPYGYWNRAAGRTKHYQLSLGIPATYRIAETEHGTRSITPIDAGQNPPDGVVVTYFLGTEPEEETTLTFMNANGEVIRHLSSRVGTPSVPTKQGVNRFVWDMKHEGARRVEGESEAGRPMYIPTVSPGTYRVRLQVGEETWEERFDVLVDPRVSISQKDLEQQHDLLIATRDKVSESSDAVSTARSIVSQIEQWTDRSTRLGGQEVVTEAAEGLREKLSVIEDELLLGSVSSDTPIEARSTPGGCAPGSPRLGTLSEWPTALRRSSPTTSTRSCVPG